MTRMPGIIRELIVCIAVLLPMPILAAPDRVARHGSDGRSTIVPEYPKIGGQSGAYVINALRAYRDGRRLGTYAAIMAAVAKPLTDEDIDNLAAYIESLEAPP
jgi:cytochrome c553